MHRATFNYSRDIEPLSYFAGRICHDLNNLTTSSMGAMSLFELKINMLHSFQNHQELERVKRSISNYHVFTQRLNQIFTEISPSHIPMDFNLALQSACQDLPRSVDLQIGFEPIKTVMDGEQMAMVIREILLNAIEASGPEDPIQVTLERIDQSIVFICKDQGRGIAPDDLAQVFTPFFSKGKRGNLVGLGLSQAGNILHQHQAKLEVVSSLGSGTETRFTLPIQN